MAPPGFDSLLLGHITVQFSSNPWRTPEQERANAPSPSNRLRNTSRHRPDQQANSSEKAPRATAGIPLVFIFCLNLALATRRLAGRLVHDQSRLPLHQAEEDNNEEVLRTNIVRVSFRFSFIRSLSPGRLGDRFLFVVYGLSLRAIAAAARVNLEMRARRGRRCRSAAAQTQPRGRPPLRPGPRGARAQPAYSVQVDI